MARRRAGGGWEVPPEALAADEQDRARGRVRMLDGSLEGDHPAFPGGRLTDVARCVEVGLEARGVLEVVAGSSPQRVRLVRRRG